VKSLALESKLKRRYTSRRIKDHDDTDSNTDYQNVEDLEIKDNQGNVTKMQPNDKF
jgi:hypothetical protein